MVCMPATFLLLMSWSSFSHTACCARLRYDFNGECDLQFIKAPEFGLGRGLEIQIRTTHRYDYSFIESKYHRERADVASIDK